MELAPAHLLSWLAQVPTPRRIWVAYSGGCDSHVLLHLLASLQHQLPCPLAAVHIHHGLQAAADAWVGHAEAVCRALSVPLTVQHVHAQAGEGESPEAAARAARYTAFRHLLGQDELLLLAHHEQDQAETLLLQLLRGAGINGLAAMPALTPFGVGWMGRPLLEVAAGRVRTYAGQQGLQWIEDPSNTSLDYDRNYLRHRLAPVVSERWPSWASTISRSARHLAEAAVLLRDQAEQDLQQVQSEIPGQLRIAALLSLSSARRQQVLRHTITRHLGLPAPDHRHLREIELALQASPDSNPCVAWPGVEVRRYRETLYITPPLCPHDPSQVFRWRLGDALALDSLGRRLTGYMGLGEAGLRLQMGQEVEIRFRQGGEVCRPAGRGHQHELKKLMQEWGVPPWERERVPLLYVEGQLAAVLGYCVCEPYAAADEQIALHIETE